MVKVYVAHTHSWYSRSSRIHYAYAAKGYDGCFNSFSPSLICPLLPCALLRLIIQGRLLSMSLNTLSIPRSHLLSSSSLSLIRVICKWAILEYTT